MVGHAGWRREHGGDWPSHCVVDLDNAAEAARSNHGGVVISKPLQPRGRRREGAYPSLLHSARMSLLRRLIVYCTLIDDVTTQRMPLICRDDTQDPTWIGYPRH